MNPIQFTVYGVPQVKGSTRAFVPKGWTRPIVTSTNKNLKDWERKIASAANDHATGVLLTEPLSVTLNFYLSRPVSLPKKRYWPSTRPDLDKLIRGATDALTKVLWHDDGQVVSIHAMKRYTKVAEEAPRVEITIQSMSEEM